MNNSALSILVKEFKKTKKLKDKSIQDFLFMFKFDYVPYKFVPLVEQILEYLFDSDCLSDDFDISEFKKILNY